jgi:hypothetical protein
MMRLIDAYPVEHFDQLRKALEALFPKLPAHSSQTIQEIDESIRSLNAGSWWNLGHIVRTKTTRQFDTPVGHLPGLPAHVEEIDVQVHHILPSIAALSFDVWLTDAAAEQLRHIHDATYSSEITFFSLLRPQRGYSVADHGFIRPRKIREWVDGLRADVEGELHGPPGLFGRMSRPQPRLPAIELYLVSGTPDGLSARWLDGARGLLRTYGIDSSLAYCDGRALYQWRRASRILTEPMAHVLLLSQEAALARIRCPHGYRTDVSAIVSHEQDELRGLLPVVVADELLQHTDRTIQSLREKAFRRMKSGMLGFLRSMSLPTGLHDRLLVESMQLARLRSEFVRSERWIALKMRPWRSLASLSRLDNQDRNLADEALTGIKEHFDASESHLSLTRDAFSEYFAAKNTWIIFWLTVVVSVLTVVQVYTNKEMMEWVKALTRVDQISALVGTITGALRGFFDRLMF